MLLDTPRDALLIVASFLAPCVAPLVRCCRAMHARFSADALFFLASAARLQSTKRGRSRLAPVAAALLARCPDLARAIPRILGERSDVFDVSATRLACLRGRQITLRDARTGVVEAELRAPPYSFYHGLAFSPDGAWLACGALGRVDVFDCASWKLATSCRSSRKADALWDLVLFTCDGGLLAASGSTVAGWAAASSEARLQLALGHALHALAASPASAVFASCHAGGRLFVWAAASGELVRALAPQGARANDAAFGPDGALLFASFRDKRVRAFCIASGECVLVYDAAAAVGALALSRAGLLALACVKANAVRVLRAADASPVAEVHVDAPRELRFAGARLFCSTGSRVGALDVEAPLVR